MLRVEDLHVRYGRIAAVRGISLHVEEGEIVSMVGPNGAGKSTTLATICGVISPAKGTIRLDGRSLVGEAPERIVRRGVSLVPEGRRILGTLTVEENLLLGATIRRRTDRAGVRRDLAETLERFPILAAYLHSPAGRLSGGEQQQLAIARALLSRPRVLLLDEPSLGLAPLLVDLVFEALGRLRDEGVTMLLIEQNAMRAVELADRSYVLRTGTIELEGTRDELLEHADFETAYLGSSEGRR
jgi:branched-chain amino acid transport system ATP-binding protein